MREPIAPSPRNATLLMFKLLLAASRCGLRNGRWALIPADACADSTRRRSNPADSNGGRQDTHRAADSSGRQDTHRAADSSKCDGKKESPSKAFPSIAGGSIDCDVDFWRRAGKTNSTDLLVRRTVTVCPPPGDSRWRSLEPNWSMSLLPAGITASWKRHSSQFLISWKRHSSQFLIGHPLFLG
jgi:hypothetical protein